MEYKRVLGARGAIPACLWPHFRSHSTCSESSDSLVVYSQLHVALECCVYLGYSFRRSIIISPALGKDTRFAARPVGRSVVGGLLLITPLSMSGDDVVRA